MYLKYLNQQLQLNIFLAMWHLTDATAFDTTLHSVESAELSQLVFLVAQAIVSRTCLLCFLEITSFLD